MCYALTLRMSFRRIEASLPCLLTTLTTRRRLRASPLARTIAPAASFKFASTSFAPYLRPRPESQHYSTEPNKENTEKHKILYPRCKKNKQTNKHTNTQTQTHTQTCTCATFQTRKRLPRLHLSLQQIAARATRTYTDTESRSTTITISATALPPNRVRAEEGSPQGTHTPPLPR